MESIGRICQSDSRVKNSRPSLLILAVPCASQSSYQTNVWIYSHPLYAGIRHLEHDGEFLPDLLRCGQRASVNMPDLHMQWQLPVAFSVPVRIPAVWISESRERGSLTYVPIANTARPSQPNFIVICWRALPTGDEATGQNGAEELEDGIKLVRHQKSALRFSGRLSSMCFTNWLTGWPFSGNRALVRIK